MRIDAWSPGLKFKIILVEGENGDILSDLGAAIRRGMGFACGGNR